MTATDRSPPDSAALISKVSAYVQDYMSNFDASHDWHHILRVVGLAKTIASTSATATAAAAEATYDPTIVTLSALLHDVGDRKYLKQGQDATTLVRNILLEFGCDARLADTVQTICSNVSYSSEVKNPARVVELVERYPELGVVQDADRLDAIGAVGIGRCFTFGGAMYGRAQASVVSNGDAAKGRGMDETMEHFEEKLVRLEGLMKTEVGRRLARERTEVLKTFMGWWGSEVDVEHVGLRVLGIDGGNGVVQS